MKAQYTLNITFFAICVLLLNLTGFASAQTTASLTQVSLLSCDPATGTNLVSVDFTVDGGSYSITTATSDGELTTPIASSITGDASQEVPFLLDNAPAAGDYVTVTVGLGTDADAYGVDTRFITFDCATGDLPPALIARDDSFEVEANTSADLLVLANDVLDGDVISLTPTDPTNGTASASTGEFTINYTPNAGFIGADSLRYEVCTATACDEASISIDVVPANEPPDCSTAEPSSTTLWPPNHQLVTIGIEGVSDADGDELTISATMVFSNEPANGTGDGDTDFDYAIDDAGGVQVRAERSGQGSGRIYSIRFTADDGNGGTCTGEVHLMVPQSMGGNGQQNGNAPDHSNANGNKNGNQNGVAPDHSNVNGNANGSQNGGRNGASGEGVGNRNGSGNGNRNGNNGNGRNG